MIKRSLNLYVSTLIFLNEKTQNLLHLFTIFIGTKRRRDGSYQPHVKRFSYRKIVVVLGEIVFIINISDIVYRFGYLETRLHRDVDRVYT